MHTSELKITTPSPASSSHLLLSESDFEISAEPVDVSGGSCDLFSAHHERFGRVAMKRLRCNQSQRDDAVRRFFREGRTWSGLNHPHVLSFHGICETPSHVYLISPFVENGALHRYLKIYPNADRARLLYETALAIEYLHDRGVIHGDIKGGNILVSSQHSALLCDFGMARYGDTDTSTLQKGAGTLRWMSPELIHHAPKSFASDVYAFGMTIYETLSGMVPFSHCTMDITVLKAIMEQQRPSKEPLVSPTGYTYEHLWDAAERAWAEDAKDRPSIANLLSLLERHTGGTILEAQSSSATFAVDEARPCSQRLTIDVSGQDFKSRGNIWCQETVKSPVGDDDDDTTVYSPSDQGSSGSSTPQTSWTPRSYSSDSKRVPRLRSNSPLVRLWRRLTRSPNSMRKVSTIPPESPTIYALEPCVSLLQRICRTIDELPSHRSRCRNLIEQAEQIVLLIQDVWASMSFPESNLLAVIDCMTRTLEELSRRVTVWMHRSFLERWVLRQDFAEELDHHSKSLEECRALIKAASTHLTAHREADNGASRLRLTSPRDSAHSDTIESEPKLPEPRTPFAEPNQPTFTTELSSQAPGEDSEDKELPTDSTHRWHSGRIRRTRHACHPASKGRDHCRMGFWARGDVGWNRINRRLENRSRLIHLHVAATQRWLKTKLIPPLSESHSLVTSGSVQPSWTSIGYENKAVVSDQTFGGISASPMPNVYGNRPSSTQNLSSPKARNFKHPNCGSIMLSQISTVLQIATGCALYELFRTYGIKAVMRDPQARVRRGRSMKRERWSLRKALASFLLSQLFSVIY